MAFCSFGCWVKRLGGRWLPCTRPPLSQPNRNQRGARSDMPADICGSCSRLGLRPITNVFANAVASSSWYRQKDAWDATKKAALMTIYRVKLDLMALYNQERGIDDICMYENISCNVCKSSKLIRLSSASCVNRNYLCLQKFETD